MDERNNFDDIILDKNNKSEKVKKLLLRIIALAILFLVVLIVMKLLSDNDTQQNALVPIPSEPASTDTDFENIPITSTTPELDEFEIFKQRMKGLDENNTATENNQSFVMPLPSSEYNTTQPLPSDPANKPKPAQVASKPAEKPKTDKPKTTETKKPATPNTQNANAEKLSAGTYIQIFSVSNFDPKSKELALIEQNGYKYKLYKTKVNDIDRTRVLVGPFSKDEINDQLQKVQDKIHKDAIIFQVK